MSGKNVIRKGMVSHYNFAFSQRQHFWSRFCHKITKFSTTILGEKVISAAKGVFQSHLNVSKHHNFQTFLCGPFNNIGNA